MARGIKHLKKMAYERLVFQRLISWSSEKLW